MADLGANPDPFFYGSHDVPCIPDRVALEHGSDLPATDAHDGRFRHTCSTQFLARKSCRIRPEYFSFTQPQTHFFSLTVFAQARQTIRLPPAHRDSAMPSENLTRHRFGNHSTGKKSRFSTSDIFALTLNLSQAQQTGKTNTR